MPNLYIISFANDEEQFHKTPLTDAALAAAKAAGAEVTEFEGCEHSIAPFEWGVGIEQFHKHAGGIDLEKLDLETFLADTGADGTDVFY